MQSFFFIGGDKDGLSYPAADDAETAQWPVGVTGSKLYISDTLAVSDVFITIYRHDA